MKIKTFLETPITSDEMNELKHLLKELRQAHPEYENYIQIIYPRLDDLTRIEFYQIYSNVDEVLTTGHYFPQQLPRLCPNPIRFY